MGKPTGFKEIPRLDRAYAPIEDRVRRAVPNSTVFTHLEPLEDPISFEDVRLERE